MNYIGKVQSYSPIAYWPMNESSGNDALDYSGNGYTGSYTGVTLGQIGIGDGETCPFFDGTNDYCNVYSPSLSSAFDGTEGTLGIWVKAGNAGVWADGTARRMINIRVDGSNYIDIGKTTTNNRIAWNYRAGGTLETRLKDSINATNWFHVAITWDKTEDEVRAYYNGVQEGATLSGLGIWAGDPTSDKMVIGAFSTTPDTIWDGFLAHPAIWNIALTAAQIAGLATAAVGDTVWGHITGVTQNPRTFVNNWAGNGIIVGSGDAEKTCISAQENMVSEVVDTNTGTVTLSQNIYDGTGDDVTLEYRHSGTVAGCQAASFVPYSAPFTSLGYVQIQILQSV